MSTSNGAVFRRVIEEGFNRGNFSAWDGCFSPGFAEHQYGAANTVEGFKQAIAGLRGAVPDLRVEIDEVAEHGDKVWARMTARGTQAGPLFGRAATNKAFTITVMDVCRFADGKIVEHWGVPDRFALLHQLGLLA